MDMAEGQDLASLLQRGPATAASINEIATQLLSTIQYLHSKNIVHSDIKATNIIYSEESKEVRLVDFGSARSVLQGSAPLTVKMKTNGRYLAPEQLREKVELASDIWQFGCLLFELFTGLIPFEKSKDKDQDLK